MLINCPKCNAVYNINASRMKNNTQKFKCAQCGTIWQPDWQEDVVELENNEVSAENNALQTVKPQKISVSAENDIDEMFNRLSQDTKGLFSNINLNQEDQSFSGVLSRKLQVIFTPIMTVCSLLLLIFIMTILIGYINRYEIVKFIPKMEVFYNNLGMESLHFGKDVIFKNVTVKPLRKNNQDFIEIVGSLYNSGRNTVKPLPIKAQIINKDGLVENETKLMVPAKHLDSQFSYIFHLTMEGNLQNIYKIVLTMEK